jgi:hypothetical protein
MKNIFIVAFVISLTAMPFFSFGAVKINEVAWMGTKIDSIDSGEWWRHEWLELFNDGTESLSLAGWKVELSRDKIDFTINLEGQIAPNSYFLIAASDKISPPPDFNYANLGGKFNNTAQKVTLKNGEVAIDTVDAMSGWPAGDNATKQTMQLVGSSWITATATPKAINFSVSAAPVSDSSSTGVDNSSSVSNTTNYSSSAHSGSSNISKPVSKTKAYLSAGRDRVVMTGTPVQFSAKLTDDSDNVLDGDWYRWSFGDGAHSNGKQAGHIYDLPGEYIAVVSTIFGGQEYMSRSSVKVVDVDVTMEAIAKNSGDYVISLNNKAPFEFNLKGWQLRSKRRIFYFETDTIILPRKSLPISKNTGLDLWAGDDLDLVYPTGKVYLSIKVKKNADLAIQPQFSGPNSKLIEEESADDVEKPVDNMGINMWKKELITLEIRLKELQDSLVANVSTPNKTSELAVDVKTATTTVMDASPEKIVIEPKQRESVFWKFIRGVFGR